MNVGAARGKGVEALLEEKPGNGVRSCLLPLGKGVEALLEEKPCQPLSQRHLDIYKV
jgi:hypothetical protein